MSSNHNNDEYVQLMDNIYHRYHKAIEGYDFDFKTEVEPFLNANKELALNVLNFETDSRFQYDTRQKVSSELMELLMSCHSPKFRERHFYEKYKFINLWIAHAQDEGLM